MLVFLAVLTCEDLLLVEDALLAGVGHKDIGGVLIGLWQVPQRDFVALLDDVYFVDGRSHRDLWLWDLVVVHVGLKTDRLRFKNSP